MQTLCVTSRGCCPACKTGSTVVEPGLNYGKSPLPILCIATLVQKSLGIAMPQRLRFYCIIFILFCRFVFSRLIYILFIK